MYDKDIMICFFHLLQLFIAKPSPESMLTKFFNSNW